MKDSDNILIWEQYTDRMSAREPAMPRKRIFRFAEVNAKGRPIPRLIQHGNSDASTEIYELDDQGEYINTLEAFFEWTWYGDYYAQTETSPGEEPVAEDIRVYNVIDSETEQQVEDEAVHDQIAELIRGELENEGISYFEALGMEWEDDGGY